MEKEEINDWNDLVNFEKKLKENNNKYFFRGHFDENWKLKSSYRRNNEKKWSKKYNEEIIISAKDILVITEEQITYMRNKNSSLTSYNDLEILAELQHHGTSTLLIDFTSSFWTALWFAISEVDYEFDLDKDKNFKIYYFKLQEEKDIKKTITNYYKKEIYQCPKEITNGLAQDSYFILDNSDTLVSDWNMETLLISYKFRDDFIKILNERNFNSINIFPGLNGLAKNFQNYSKEYLVIASIQLNDLNKTNDALIYCEKALEIDHNFPFAWHNKGLILIKQEKHDEAYECVNKAIKLDPTIFYFYNTMGAILGSDKGKFKNNESKEMSLEYLDKAIKLNPNSIAVFYNKALTLDKLNRNAEAIIYYDKVLEINPNVLDAHNNKGVCLGKIGKIEESIISFDKAIEVNSTYIPSYNNKGVALNTCGEYEKANVSFDKALQLDHYNFEANIGKGISLQKNMPNKREIILKAMAYFNNALLSNPDHSMIHIALELKGDCLKDLNRKEEAIKTYNEILRSNPFNALIKMKINILKEKL